MSTEYIVTCGLEVHVQLKTQSKMYCACPTSYGDPPNTHTCPTCLGLPGALPVINEEAVRLTILTGLMFGCKIAERCKWDRKNYFYADMPKNYQISQYDMPLCEGGEVILHDLAYPKDAQKNIETPDKAIRLTRIHLEEDVAKSFHFETNSGIDFNRAGSPLMEIVSEPDIRSAEEAFAYLTSLRQHLVYADVSDADMEKGQMRCDVNISVRPKGQKEYNPKVELKNLNSISAVRRGLQYEIERQTEALENDEKTFQETRRWDDDAGVSYPMRTKEMAHDYRYFPDPDLLPVETPDLVAAVRERLPELPGQKRDRFVEEYGVTTYDAAVIANDLALSSYFEDAAHGAKNPKGVANWIMNDLQAALSTAELTIMDCPIPAARLKELVNLTDSGRINSRQAKEIFALMFEKGSDPNEVIKDPKYAPADESEVEGIIDEVIAANPKPAEDFAAGNDKSLNFLKGQVMKLSKGKANPQKVGEIIAQKLRG